MFSSLQQIDATLVLLGEGLADRLRRPMRTQGPKAATPLALITGKGLEGAREVVRDVARASLEHSVETLDRNRPNTSSVSRQHDCPRWSPSLTCEWTLFSRA